MNDYKQYFMETERVTGKGIVIVNPKKFDAFLEAVAADAGIDDETKAFIFLSLSGGLRISEVLALKASDFSVKLDGSYSINAQVLKKRVKTTRKIGLHPACKPFIDAILCHKRYNEFILYQRADRGTRTEGRKFTRNDIAYRLRKAFDTEGFSCHSLRHSLISYLVNKKRPATYISSLLKITPNMIYRYSHIDGSEAFNEEFSQGA